MTIRSTKNASIISKQKQIHGKPMQGEGREHVLAGASEAAAVGTEKRDIDDRAAYQSTTPSEAHNGPKE